MPSPVPPSSSLSWATEPWLTCPYGHAHHPYQVCISRSDGPARLEHVVVADASKWLCEIRCLRKNCTRKWLACMLCQIRFPGRGTLSDSTKRPRNHEQRSETSDAVNIHQSDVRHIAAVRLLSLQVGGEDDDSRMNTSRLLPLHHDLLQQSSSIMEEDDDFEQGVPFHQAPTTITTATDQSDMFTSQIVKSTVACNSNVGHFIQKENSERMLGPRHVVSMACDESRRPGDAWKVSYANPAPVFGTKFMFAYTQIFDELSTKTRRKFVSVVDVALNTPPAERLGPI